MKIKKRARVLSILYLSSMLLMLLSLSTAVYAADAYDPLQVEIPYNHIYYTMDTAADSVFHYIITAEDSAPIPAEATESGSFSFDGASGSGEKYGDYTYFELPGELNFTFNRPGVYVYEINADMETDGKKINVDRYTFDPNTTTLTIYISNAPGEGMKLQAYAIENEKGVKLSGIVLDPSYKFSAEIPTQNPEKVSVPTAESYSTETVLTGDSGYSVLYASMAGISGICVILLIVFRKKGREENA